MSNYLVIRPYDAPKRKRKQPASPFPAALAVTIAVMLVIGFMGYQGTGQDLRDVKEARLAEDTLTMERVVRVAVAEDRAEKRFADQNWMDTMTDCLHTEGCREQVVGVKPRGKR